MNYKYESRKLFIASLVSCMIAALLFGLFYSTALYQDVVFIQRLMRISLILCIVVFGFSSHFTQKEGSGQLRLEKQVAALLTAIIVMGIIMRIGYMLYTPFELRGHDIGLGACGHADYIINLIEGRLPDTNRYQFYHPPLFHFLAAALSWLFHALTGEQDVKILLEAGKLVSCWSSIVTLFLSAALCRELEIGKAGKTMVIAVSAFLPEHYLLAGRLNNDALSIMFMTAIVLYTIKWYRRQSMHDTIMLALCYGLGMMTKISVGTLAPVTGALMILALYKNLRKGNGTQTFLQYLAFSLIAFPLGLWYPIRNLIRFGQPLNYVFQQETAGPLYCGDHKVFSRFFSVFDHTLYADPFSDYKVLPYLVKTSVFGEFKYDVPIWIPQILLICAWILAAAGLIVMVGRFICKPSFQDRLLAAFWAAIIASYLWFNVKYPFGCTMDFRYAVPSALIGSIFLGKWEDVKKTGFVEEMAGYMTWISLGMFCLMSCLMYVMIKQ